MPGGTPASLLKKRIYKKSIGVIMNIIDAIVSLISNPILNISPEHSGNNRATNAGDALEEYVKNLFADAIKDDEVEQNRKRQETFSYLGNKSNPPDAMLKHGDAIEIKKIERADAALALNSSYPKHKLSSDCQMLSTACRNAEDDGWTEKDMIYVVGTIPNQSLTQLCMVYGMDYCASEECYKRIKETIKSGVELIEGIDFSETTELGKIKKVDPLGITDLRVRGMWSIENPLKVFSYEYQPQADKKFNFMCIINEDKWNSFSNTDLLKTIEKSCSQLSIKDIQIKNPDNPAQLKKAKLITFYKD